MNFLLLILPVVLIGYVFYKDSLINKGKIKFSIKEKTLKENR